MEGMKATAKTLKPKLSQLGAEIARSIAYLQFGEL